MDPEVKALLGPVDVPPGRTESVTTLRIKEDYSGDIEVDSPDGPRPYTLKPLGDLYGMGTGVGYVDPRDDRFMPLMQSIEEEIARYYETEAPSLTDGAVSLALAPLAMSPESAVTDPLARRVLVALRLTLSLNDYSRQEVRQGLRHVVRSVERHSRVEGRRGYLNFITQFFGRRR